MLDLLDFLPLRSQHFDWSDKYQNTLVSKTALIRTSGRRLSASATLFRLGPHYLCIPTQVFRVENYDFCGLSCVRPVKMLHLSAKSQASQAGPGDFAVKLQFAVHACTTAISQPKKLQQNARETLSPAPTLAAATQKAPSCLASASWPRPTAGQSPTELARSAGSRTVSKSDSIGRLIFRIRTRFGSWSVIWLSSQKCTSA